jgi:hypothetical protein
MDDEDNIVAFTGFTGASTTVARHYLRLTDNDAQQAIQLFFDSPELASAIPPEPSGGSASTSQRRRGNIGREDESGVVHIDSDSDHEDMDVDNHLNNETNVVDRSAMEEDDAAMARRLQEEMYAGGDMGAGVDADGVRAPMERRTETLVGPGADWGSGDIHDDMLQQSRAYARRNGKERKKGSSFHELRLTLSRSRWSIQSEHRCRRFDMGRIKPYHTTPRTGRGYWRHVRDELQDGQARRALSTTV